MLILTGSDGKAGEFVAGDAVMVPRGFTGTRDMRGDYRKLIIYQRKP